MAPLTSIQPFKAIATLAFIAVTPAYLFALSLLYSLGIRRPVSSWPLKPAIGNEFMRLWFNFQTRIRLKPFYANPAKLKERYVSVQPGPSSLYTGVLEHKTIKPTAMPAVWMPALPSNYESARVVIHFQGGAFVLAPDPAQAGKLATDIFAEEMGATTLYAQYRLSWDDSSRFPAAIQDAVSFYNHVLDQGVRADNIVISGDSAGGNVAIGLIRYIEATKALPSPRGVMLWSPWIDVSDAALTRALQNPNRRIDFLPFSLLKWGKEAYEPLSTFADEESVQYLRPVEYPFSSQTPIFVNAGTVELFFDDISVFAKSLEGVKGNNVRFVETKDAMHDVILCGSAIGFEQQAREAVREAGEFFNIAKL